MIYVVLLLSSFSLTYFIKNFYLKKSFLATVNERSSHTEPIPHGGGIAIALTWFSGLTYLYFINEIDPVLFFALLAGVGISLVSFFDDIYELGVKSRLIVQSCVAALGLYSIGGVDAITFGIVDINYPIITNIFAFLLIIWFINLTNFIDGINGYVGSEFIFISIAGFLFFGGSHFLVLAVSVLGFLYWNWNRAKIFMGDVGSTLLGYNIAIFTLYYTNQDLINLWIWIVLFEVFWFDATLTLIRRKFNGEKLSIAHKKHAYQRLVQAGWSHYKVTNYSIGLNILLFILIFVSLMLEINIFIPFFISLVLLYSAIKFVDSKKKFE